MRILKSLDLNRDPEIYRKISNHNLKRWLKICKRSYTKRSVNNQKVQKFVAVLDGNFSVKNVPKRSAKYLKDKIYKTKETQNISVTLRTFLNQQKTFFKKI